MLPKASGGKPATLRKVVPRLAMPKNNGAMKASRKMLCWVSRDFESFADELTFVATPRKSIHRFEVYILFLISKPASFGFLAIELYEPHADMKCCPFYPLSATSFASEPI